MKVLTLGIALSLLALLATQADPSRAFFASLFTQTNQPGFGDDENSYAWSMQWYKDKLYVGTGRNVNCVENWTVDFYLPGLGFYQEHPTPETTCPANRHDLDLRAEIWQYTPGTNQWKRVFQSPNDLPNPQAPGKLVARDTSFRGMTVFVDGNGQEWLFVGGVALREILAGLPGPRLLRTQDGETFEPIQLNLPVVEHAGGDAPPTGFRALVQYQDRLFVTVSPGLVGDGVVLEVGEPTGPNPTFTQVSPRSLQVFELEVFNDYLYAGAGSASKGYSVWKTKATGSLPYAFTPIVTDGAGRGPLMTSVVSMHPFRGRLYVGSNGWLLGLLAQSELIRINPDDTWQLVVGNYRNTVQGEKFPISGLPDGFGNPFNSHFWRMQRDGLFLYLGTNDASWTLRFNAFFDSLLKSGYGFDIFSSLDGQFWFPLTNNAFGNKYDFGARTMAATPSGFYVGSANHVEGARVWRGPAFGTPSQSKRREAAQASGAPDSPGRLDVELAQGQPVLSWEPTGKGKKVRVLRSEFRPNSQVGVKRQTPLPPLPDDERRLRIPQLPGSAGLPDDAWIPGPYTPLAKTGKASYVDRTAKPGVRYGYYVEFEERRGSTSRPSNLVIVPREGPPVTFEQVLGALEAPSGERRAGRAVPSELLQPLADAWLASERGELARARERVAALGEAVEAASGGALEAWGAEDLGTLLAQLERRLRLAEEGLIGVEGLGGTEAPARVRRAASPQQPTPTPTPPRSGAGPSAPASPTPTPAGRTR